MPPFKNVTISDIAGHVGVSRTTVHKALNDLPGINIKTKEKIKNFANLIGYRPNLLPAALDAEKPLR